MTTYINREIEKRILNLQIMNFFTKIILYIHKASFFLCVKQDKDLQIQDLLFNLMNKLFIRKTLVSLRQVQFCCLIQSYPHFEPFQLFQNWNNIAGLRCFFDNDHRPASPFSRVFKNCFKKELENSSKLHIKSTINDYVSTSIERQKNEF